MLQRMWVVLVVCHNGDVITFNHICYDEFYIVSSNCVIGI